MSAAPGVEALDVRDREALDVRDREALDVRSREAREHHLEVRHARAAPVERPDVEQQAAPSAGRPRRPAGPDALPTAGPADWAAALRLRSLPAGLLGAAVAVLLLAGSTGVRPGSVGTAIGGLVVVHLLRALLGALADSRPGRAGPLPRALAGRAVLGLVALGAALTVALVVLTGAEALLLAAAALAALALRRPTPAAAGLAAAVSCAAVWWVGAGSLPWQVLVAALPVGLVVAALRTEPRSRLLLAAPAAGVGLAVAVHALPWPALLVALCLPVARRAARSGRGPAAPARLAALLLLAGLALAVATGGTAIPLAA